MYNSTGNAQVLNCLLRSCMHTYHSLDNIRTATTARRTLAERIQQQTDCWLGAACGALAEAQSICSGVARCPPHQMNMCCCAGGCTSGFLVLSVVHA
jgi:hypothetical protein